jgi:hypothetical protein
MSTQKKYNASQQKKTKQNNKVSKEHKNIHNQNNTTKNQTEQTTILTDPHVTMPVNKISLTKREIEKLIKPIMRKRVESLVSDLDNPNNPIKIRFHDLLLNNTVKLKGTNNKKFLFHPKLSCITRDFDDFEENDKKLPNQYWQYLPQDKTKKLLNGSTVLPNKCKGKIIRVSKEGTGRLDGKTWETAYGSVENAVKNAKDGDHIWIAKGKYTESIRLEKNLSFFGGFLGNEKSILERNINIYKTEFTNPGNTIFSASKGSHEFHGIFFHNAAVALSFSNCSINLFDCIVSNCKNNSAFILSNCNSDIINSKFLNNSKGNKDNGGAIFAKENSNIYTYNVTFDGNEVRNYGGAVYLGSSKMYCLNCNFINNKTTTTSYGYGAVLYAVNKSYFRHYNSSFSNNKSYFDILYSSSSEISESKSEHQTKLESSIQQSLPAKKLSISKTNERKTLEALRDNDFKLILNKQDSDLGFYISLLKLYYLQDNFDIDKMLSDILANKYCELFTRDVYGYNLNSADTISLFLSGKGSMDKNTVTAQLLECDHKRADMDMYDEKILTDPNRGHWELWNQQDNKNSIQAAISDSFFARNPIEDINKSGLIAIDFGTKSTVVAMQKGTSHIFPMRVGFGRLDRDVKPKDFENPTAIEFISIENFMKDYEDKLGRPSTKWSDVTVSHRAANGQLDNGSEHYYSVFSEMKQWAASETKKIRLKDKTGTDIILPPFSLLSDSDIDPIEIYAYYLGLYINNMKNGIFLDYVLSFPVTYEKKIRNKILSSFEKGIKKSLPEIILSDTDSMDSFRVRAGAGEPAAYAVCALKEYGFEPENDKLDFYGIFDFGGGTTDFDFGVWREATSKERRFDYIIEHFGSGGDRYLGGENLLDLCAFEVFKANHKVLREKKITFTIPENSTQLPGMETLINESQESQLNTRILMEKLRPIWERHQNYEKLFSKGFIKIQLYNNSGNKAPEIDLKITIDQINDILTKRISEGVDKFFESLRKAYQNPITKKCNKVNIFLAGNSSKSEILRELFDKKIEKEMNDLKEFKSSVKNENFFEIHKPLGVSKDQKEIDFIKPNGKTGVAYGLIMSRPGGKIKVINYNVKADDEAQFCYHLGYEKKGKFKISIPRTEDYGKWIEFIDAGYEDFEVYYTSSDVATTGKLMIDETDKRSLRLPLTNENANVYIKLSSPKSFHFVAAKGTPADKNNHLHEAIEVRL